MRPRRTRTEGEAVARSLFWSKFWIRTRLAGLFPSVRRLVGPETAALRYYSDRVLAAPIERLLDPALFPPAAGPHVVDLNLAAPRFETASSLNRLSIDRDGQPHARGLEELRDAIAADALIRNGIALDPGEQVQVTHGAAGAYAAALDAFVNPDDRVVVFDPCSPLFALGAASRRARVMWVPTWIEDGRCRFHPAALRKALRGAKLLAFSDPGNPTGASFSLDDRELIATMAAKSDTLVYQDDSFGRFRPQGESHSLATFPLATNRTLLAGSATSLGLGSARVGWLCGPRGLINAVSVAANLSAPFVPAACQHIATRALRETDDQAFAPIREQFRSRRQFAFDRLQAMGLQPESSSGGYFLWVNIAHLGMTGRVFAEQLYQHRQVLIGPGDLYSPTARTHIRVSFAIEDGRLREGLMRMASFLNGEPAPDMPKAERPEREEPRVFNDIRRPAFSRA